MQFPLAGAAGGTSGSQRASKALNETGRALQKVLEKLATAQRINRASDDAAGLAIAEQLTTQTRGFKMASQNISDAMAAANIADYTANTTTDIVQRQRELALQARNDTLTNEQRQGLNVEYQQLNEELNRMAAAANYNTQGVANGQGLAGGTAQIQVGPNAGDMMNLPSFDVSANALGLAGTNIGSTAGAAAAIQATDNALQQLGTQRSRLGATVNRMESALNNVNVSMINTQAAESVLRDQDMAAGMADLTRLRLMQEGGTRAFSRFQEISANHLMGLLQ